MRDSKHLDNLLRATDVRFPGISAGIYELELNEQEHSRQYHIHICGIDVAECGFQQTKSPLFRDKSIVIRFEGRDR